MRFKAKGIGHGNAKGEVVASQSALSFLGGVDTKTGTVLDKSSDICGKSFSGKILAFPHGKGSTVGSYVVFQLKKSGTAPAAMINQKAEAIVATGAILSDIPMLTGVPMDIFSNGDQAVVDADEGWVEIPGIEEVPVSTVILRNEGEILLLRRSAQVGSYQGYWAGVSGRIETGESPAAAAVRELKEETQLDLKEGSLGTAAPPVYARDGKILWKIFPFMCDIGSREISLDWEHDESEWVDPSQAKFRQTVPKLDKVVESLMKIQDSKKIC